MPMIFLVFKSLFKNAKLATHTHSLPEVALYVDSESSCRAALYIDTPYGEIPIPMSFGFFPVRTANGDAVLALGSGLHSGLRVVLLSQEAIGAVQGPGSRPPKSKVFFFLCRCLSGIRQFLSYYFIHMIPLVANDDVTATESLRHKSYSPFDNKKRFDFQFSAG